VNGKVYLPSLEKDPAAPLNGKRLDESKELIFPPHDKNKVNPSQGFAKY
jgi:hypothetical protein